MRVENDEMYGDWAHWLEARCPACPRSLRAHHLHDFASVVCPGCGTNPVLHFSGLKTTRRHGRALVSVLLAEGLIPDVAADVALELKADADLRAFVEFLLSMHYVKPDALESLVRKLAPPAWIEAIVMTFDPGLPASKTTRIPAHGERIMLAEYELTPELLRRVPKTIARVYRCIPVWADGSHIVLAVADLQGVRAADIAGLLGCEVALVTAPRSQLAELLKAHYGAAGWQDAFW
ncbi:MAG: hypothetical protein HUU15_11980 [Candidatus Brocadiae bacterium]|nr:hypothetical protein [Candidatus Brocadiia bacterium]